VFTGVGASAAPALDDLLRKSTPFGVQGFESRQALPFA
jgi:hypothetical protein